MGARALCAGGSAYACLRVTPFPGPAAGVSGCDRAASVRWAPHPCVIKGGGGGCVEFRIFNHARAAFVRWAPYPAWHPPISLNISLSIYFSLPPSLPPSVHPSLSLPSPAPSLPPPPAPLSLSSSFSLPLSLPPSLLLSLPLPLPLPLLSLSPLSIYLSIYLFAGLAPCGTLSLSARSLAFSS